MTLRPIRAYREISKDLTTLRAQQETAEADARREIAQRASLYSKRSQKVVDETMTLSAVLMRAGEVDEAHRLLAEVDREVTEGKVALIESVNEVKTRQVVTKKKMTRLRMARMLLTAILGASLMAFSAFGVALARFLAPAPAQGAQNESVQRFEEAGGSGASDGVKHIHFAGVKIPLTQKQLAEFERLTAAGADDEELSEFLKKVLSRDLVDRITTVAAPVTDEVSGALGSVKKAVKGSTGTTTDSEPGTTEKKDSEKPSDPSNDGSQGGADRGGEDDKQDDDGCKSGSGDDRGDSSSVSIGGCIPVVNEESPV